VCKEQNQGYITFLGVVRNIVNVATKKIKYYNIIITYHQPITKITPNAKLDDT
jgi:hypothetical protein